MLVMRMRMMMLMAATSTNSGKLADLANRETSKALHVLQQSGPVQQNKFDRDLTALFIGIGRQLQQGGSTRLIILYRTGMFGRLKMGCHKKVQ